MTTTESRMPAVGPAPLIEELFCQGHAFEHVVSAGVEIGWTREDVNAVLRERQWDLDGSGRLPRSKRITAPLGLRAARPPAAAAPAAPGRRATPAASPRRPVIDAPPIDDWDGPDAPDVDAVPDDAASQPPSSTYVAIAEWADDDAPVPVDTPAPEATPAQPPTARSKPRPAVRPTVPDPSDELVERFLTERTVPAPADQFLTSPQLRQAFEEWRGTADAPAVSPRKFGSALSARYGKRQSSVVIDGVKPMCYFGLAWKLEESSDATDQPASLLEVQLVEEARPAAPAVTADQLAEVRAELTAQAGAAPPDTTISPAASDQPVDLLATGLAHPNRRVRAAAAALERAVDALTVALSRAGRTDG